MPPLVPARPRFISPRFAGDAEIVGVGDDLSPETLLWAYGQGIFPWPISGYPLLWFCPPRRAVLEFDRLHLSERLARTRRRTSLTFTVDAAFDRVIDGCRRSPRPGGSGTWITPAMVSAYSALHHRGDAHSVEAWDDSGALVGGLYGVDAGGVFCGESMFHTAADASKLALLFLCAHLKQRGSGWIDIQVMTPHLASLGAHEIPRDLFLDRLQSAQARGLVLF